MRMLKTYASTLHSYFLEMKMSQWWKPWWHRVRKKKTTTYIHSFQRHVWKKTQEMKTKRSVFAIKLLTFWNGMWNISRMCECVLCIVCIYVSFCLCCFSHANFVYITQVVYLLLFFPYLRWWMAIVSVK